ncbi:ComF family protein [Thalassotalea mangrovi]|uniref:ComF family protein n=1 Tax=Thalassotalea mangrovi TaxID=2572245 RepID=A0A4V5NWC6_9GAMM|nr:ComF family protein [Thalassotalea mangrovi]TKB46349.1 ComF family protein [Thalassotalea mangrovi]
METTTASYLYQNIARQLQRLWHHWLSLGPCLWCSQQKNQAVLLCTSCQQALPRFTGDAEFSNLLSLPAIANHITHKHIDTLLAFGPYQFPLDQWISGLKFQLRPELARLLGALLAEHIETTLSYQQSKPDLIMPVPLHWRRLKWRQYNQATLLARIVSRRCQIPLAMDDLKRWRSTNTQVGLGGQGRRRNLRGAFRVDLRGQLPEHVAIVDDVLTSGTTANELARILKKAGVKRVSVYCVAISLKR